MALRTAAGVADLNRLQPFEDALKAYLEGARKIIEAHYDKMGYDYSPGETFEFELVADVKPNTKFVRVVKQERGSRAVYSFIERSTGNVLKADSWKKPAKHPRGNIYSEKHGLETHNWFGPAYLR
jgi:hypothetical protein